jgi:hypothetical protein
MQTKTDDRLHVAFPVRNECRPVAGSSDGTPHPDVTSQRLAHVEQICVTLFERWCEQRNVLALTYLMYGWPLMGGDPYLVRRLVQSLRELGEHHQEALLNEDAELLRLLLNYG